jgi:phosphomannomutase
MRQLKIGTSSVRGTVGEPLTPEMIVDFACAFGTYCDGGTVIVGRDTRKSSNILRAAVVSSLLSTGCRVIDIGIFPTPLISYAARTLNAAGGISITGSHNDIRWNALKFLAADGTLLNAVSSEEVLDIYHAGEFTRVPWDGLQRCEVAPDDLLDSYIQHLLAHLDVERIRDHHLRVAIDFCNGTGAPVAARLLQALDCTFIPLNEQTDTDFAHPPAPSESNMRQLGALLRYLEADLGASVNIDGDRIGFVTSNGVPLSEEYTFPLIADHILSCRPGPLVTNLSTSKMVDEVARCYGQHTVRTFIGEAHVVDKALAEHAAVAGEGSGGVAVLPASHTFDAFLSLGVMLEAMASTGESLQALVDRLPQFFMRKGTLSCPPNLVYHILDGFRSSYSAENVDLTEGIRIEWDDAWFHVRASNTEPLLRVIVEAKEATRAETLFDEVMTKAQRLAFGHAVV